MARAMRSIIPGFRDFNSETAPVRNGRPPQTYITVPRTGEIQTTKGNSGSWYRRIIANMVLKTTTGTATTSMIQNRRRNWAT